MKDYDLLTRIFGPVADILEACLMTLQKRPAPVPVRVAAVSRKRSGSV